VTPEQRCQELRWLLHSDGVELIAKGFKNFGDVHQRVEELVGRSVWTHELLFEDELCEEIASGQPSSVEDVIMRMQRAAPDKPVLVVDADTGDVRRVQ
jgi:hypothetical protein